LLYIRKKIVIFYPFAEKLANEQICAKFCTWGRLADVIACFKFLSVSWAVSNLCGSNFVIIYWLSRSPL